MDPQAFETTVHSCLFFMHIEGGKRIDCAHGHDGGLALDLESVHIWRWTGRTVFRMREFRLEVCLTQVADDH